MATFLVSEHKDISSAVVECSSCTVALCRELKARRPDLEIIGILADDQAAPPSDCLTSCTLCRTSMVESLASLLRGGDT